MPRTHACVVASAWCSVCRRSAARRIARRAPARPAPRPTCGGCRAQPAAVRTAAELDPVPKVVVVVDGDNASCHALELIRAGADALVDRRSPSTELLNTVLRVIDGQQALDARSANALISELCSRGSDSRPDYSRMLTRREREVLSLLTDGLDNRAIATKLFIAEATVKFHLHNIMAKFGVHKRAALVSAALRGQR